MSRLTLKLSLVLSIIVLASLAFILMQYSSYLKQRGQLLRYDEENRQLLKVIEPVLLRQESFARDLAELRRRYDVLRRQVPVELQLTEFKQQLERQFQTSGLKVLAQREAHFNRSSYREVRLSYSLKGQVRTVQQVEKTLLSQPRLIVSRGAEKESKENTGLVLSIFSAPDEEGVIESVPACVSEAGASMLSFLNVEAGILYEDYLRTCRVLAENDALYRDMQHYRYLNESIVRLEKIRDSLTQLQ